MAASFYFTNAAEVAPVLTASHNTADADFVRDGMTSLKWVPGNATSSLTFTELGTFDFFAVTGTNWDTGGTGSGPSCELIIDSVSKGSRGGSGLTDNEPAFWQLHNESVATDIVFDFTNGADMGVGEVYYGYRFALPRGVGQGYKPGRYADPKNRIDSRVGAGNFAGQIIRDRNVEENFSIQLVDESWLDSNFFQFKAMRGELVFFLPDDTDATNYFYGYVDMEDPVQSRPKHYDLNFRMEGVSNVP